MAMCGKGEAGCGSSPAGRVAHATGDAAAIRANAVAVLRMEPCYPGRCTGAEKTPGEAPGAVVFICANRLLQRGHAFDVLEATTPVAEAAALACAITEEVELGATRVGSTDDLEL